MTEDTQKKRLPGLLDEPPINFYPSLAVRIGANKAVILQQIHFLIGIKRQSEDPTSFMDGRWWVYNTYEDWHRKFFTWLSVSTIKRVLRELEADKILLSRPYPGDTRTKYYTIDDDYWPTWFAMPPDSDPEKSGSKKSVLGANTAQKSPQIRLKMIRDSGSKESAIADQNDPQSSLYKESEISTEITPEITPRETPPSPVDSITAAASPQTAGGGDGQTQLPLDCQSFLEQLHGDLATTMGAMPDDLKLAWFYEVRDGRNPAGLLASRLQKGDVPAAFSLRWARDVIRRGDEFGNLSGTVSDIVQTSPYNTVDKAALEAANWDPRVALGFFGPEEGARSDVLDNRVFDDPTNKTGRVRQGVRNTGPTNQDKEIIS